MKVNITQYAKTLLELTDGKSESEVLEVVKRFAEQLKNDGQLKNSGKIMEKFADLYNVANGIVEAKITTRYKIQDTRYKQIEDFVKEKYGAKKVEIENIIDEKVKGGIIIKVGDEVLDASISGQLKNLQSILGK